MPGPKYVENFEFPSSFGFTGSASDSPFTNVRPHVRRRRYAEGGKVESEADRKARLAAERLEKIREAKRKGTLGSSRKQPAPDPKKEANTIRAETTDPVSALKGSTRREQEKKLGLKKGGKACKPMKKAQGGAVDSALVRRKEPTNQLDAESGGRGPLRPGFKKGGMKCGPSRKRAMGGPVK